MPHTDLLPGQAREGSSSEPALFTAQPGVSQPDDPLYIYYLQGRIPPEQFRSHPGFIGNWQEDDLSFLFFTRPAADAVAGYAAAASDVHFIDEFRTTYGEWQGGPVLGFSRGSLVFRPPWEEIQAAEEGRVLRLDPGVVFGTGLHATTLGCLEALESVCGSQPPRSALDMGTGSGVLALAAAALGISRVIALDLNPLAVLTASRNIGLNRFRKSVLPVQARAEEGVDLPAELLMANIHYEVMRQVVGSPSFAAKPRFILSGLLRGQGEDIRRQLRRIGSDIDAFWHSEDGWAFIVGRNRQ